MNAKTTMRKMTNEERLKLVQFSNAVTFKKKLSQGAENAFVMWAVSLLGIFIVGGIGKWLIEKTFNYKFSLSPEESLWGVLILITCSALYAIISSCFWVRNWGNDYKPLVKADLEANNAVQETLTITEVKAFIEPEHGGIVYFLHNLDGRTFVLHYSDNFVLPPEKRSPFIVKKTLTLIYAPKSGFLLKKTFTGSIINSKNILDLTAPPEKWPETETWSIIAWEDLEKELSAEYNKT